jgi:hypothetical protein
VPRRTKQDPPEDRHRQARPFSTDIRHSSHHDPKDRRRVRINRKKEYGGSRAAGSGGFDDENET